MVYFFIIWPERNEDWEMGVRHCLRTAVPNAPMDSHLYIIHLELGTLSAWEYYTVKDVPVFERINLEMESDLMRRVIRRGDFRGVTFKGVIHVINEREMIKGCPKINVEPRKPLADPMEMMRQ